MAGTASITFRSVTGGQNERRIGYLVDGATDDNDALDLMESTASLTYDGMPRVDIDINEIDFNRGRFFCTAIYSRTNRATPATSDVEYSFDFSLTNQTIKQSLSTVNAYVASGTATDFDGAIAVDADGVAQGADIRVPIASFEVRYYPANAVVTSTYQKAVRDLVGKVNTDTFYGHAAGEVLFVGASGSSRNGTDWELVYRFEVSPNKTGITIGDITGIAVNGWDVLWVYYKQSTSTTNRYIQTPKQVNVERVYERDAFGTVLGI